MAQRHFTAEEANALLPSVRPIAERMVAHRRALAVATVRHARIATKIAGNGGGVQPQELDRLTAARDAEAEAVVRCDAKPITMPTTADEARRPPATARTCGITSSAESSPTTADDARMPPATARTCGITSSAERIPTTAIDVVTLRRRTR